jgi:glycine/serine hydroxymethyltransferase
MDKIQILAHKQIETLFTPTISDALYDFTEYCVTELKINGEVLIKLLPRKTEGTITTGGFNLGTNEITTRFEGRAVADVARTIAHELVHFQQKERGEFNDGKDVPDIGGFIEDEANAVAGQLVKKFVKAKEARYIYEL